jgi:hypothetical protein
MKTANVDHSHIKAEITDFAHEHTKNDITDFNHTHAKSDITDFPIDLVDKQYVDDEINRLEQLITDLTRRVETLENQP